MAEGPVMRTTQWHYGLSLLRIIATLLVIHCHVCNSLTGHPEWFAMTEGQAAFLSAAESALEWHVPVFFTITGALLLEPDRRITPVLCVKKYAFRMVLALFVFGVPFALITRIFDGAPITAKLLLIGIGDVFTGRSWDHLWYVYVLIGIYLVLPVLRAFTSSASRREQGFVLAVLLIFCFGTNAINRLLGIGLAFSVPFSYPLFYCLLGHYLADGKPRPLDSKWFCALVLALLASASVLLEYHAPIWMSAFGGSSGLFNAAGAAVAFSLFRELSVPAGWEKGLRKLDRLCFGVFLIHPVFIHFAYSYLHLTPLSFQQYPAATFCFFLVFSVLSYFASWIMSLIPPLKKYIL